MGHDYLRDFLKWADLKFMSLKLFSSRVVCFGIILFTTFSLFKKVVVNNCKDPFTTQLLVELRWLDWIF